VLPAGADQFYTAGHLQSGDADEVPLVWWFYRFFAAVPSMSPGLISLEQSMISDHAEHCNPWPVIPLIYPGAEFRLAAEFLAGKGMFGDVSGGIACRC